MEVVTLARNLADKFSILLNREEGITYGAYAGIQIVYGQNIYNVEGKHIYQDFLTIQKLAKITLTHIQGEKDSKSLQLMIPSTESYQYMFKCLQCDAPYNQLGKKLQKDYSNNQLQIPNHITRIETLNLENVNNIDKMILKIL